MIRLAIILAALAASPVSAKWHYCYDGAMPAGVNRYTDYPPRPFGFEIALLPATFKKLCGQDHLAEADHVRRLVAEHLECPPDSDLSMRIESILLAPKAEALGHYFGAATSPNGPEWNNVCDQASLASVQNLAFADTWYFDSPTPAQDRAKLDALLAALNELSEVLE